MTSPSSLPSKELRVSLLACPYCGAGARLMKGDLGGRWVECTARDCHVATRPLYRSPLKEAEQMVAAIWNRRV